MSIVPCLLALLPILLHSFCFFCISFRLSSKSVEFMFICLFSGSWYDAFDLIWSFCSPKTCSSISLLYCDTISRLHAQKHCLQFPQVDEYSSWCYLLELELRADSLSSLIPLASTHPDSGIFRRLVPARVIGMWWMWFDFVGVSFCCTHRRLIGRKTKCKNPRH